MRLTGQHGHQQGRILDGAQGVQKLGGHVNRLARDQGNIAVLHVEDDLTFENLHENGVHAVVLVPRLTGCQLHEG